MCIIKDAPYAKNRLDTNPYLGVSSDTLPGTSLGTAHSEPVSQFSRQKVTNSILEVLLFSSSNPLPQNDAKKTPV